MLRCQILVSLLVSLVGGVLPSFADEVRYYDKDGVTYRETRRVVQRPIVETQTRESTQTFYREQYTTKINESVQERWTPVTDYRLESYWVGRWNPFVDPYLAQRYVPYTRWERTTEIVKTPVTCRQLVPETRTVRVPVTTQRLVDEEIIARVVVSGRGASSDLPWAAPTNTAKLVPVVGSQGPIGGTAKLESDPPRQGPTTAWKASGAEQR
jgi:hypothetical protein